MAWPKRRPKDGEKPKPQEDPRAYLLRVLGSRDYSRAQLEAKLRERGHASDRIESALRDLIDAGLFREESFASARIRALLRKGYGPSWIRMKLRGEKIEIDDAMIEEAYTHLGITEAEQVRDLVRKSLRSSRTAAQLSAAPRATRTKLLKSLMGKGHSRDLASQALDVLTGK